MKIIHADGYLLSGMVPALCQTLVCFILSEAMRLMLLYLKGFLCWYFSLLLHVSSIIFAKNALSGCQLLELIFISFCFPISGITSSMVVAIKLNNKQGVDACLLGISFYFIHLKKHYFNPKLDDIKQSVYVANNNLV